MKRHNGEKIFWGLFFVLGAIFLLVGKMGILQDVNVVTIFFAIFLAAWFVRSVVRLEFTGLLFSLAFLAILFDDQLGITAITPLPVLAAALLGSIGLGMIFHRHPYHHHWEQHSFEERTETIDVEDTSCFSFSTKFGSSIKYINTDDFKQANLGCSFGAMKVYFDTAVIQNGSATVKLDVSFSGVELYIPKGWQVENHVISSFGAIDEKNRAQSNGTPVLNIVGNISFGGVEIIYV